MSTKPRMTPRLISRDNSPDPRVAANDENPFRSRARPEGHAFCPSCKAVYNGSRWTWDLKPEDAHEHTCPVAKQIARVKPPWARKNAPRRP